MIDGKSLFIFFVIIIAAFGGVLYGYDLGIISGALTFMQRDIPMTPAEMHVIPGAVLFGGAIATLVTGPLCDWVGRKKMIFTAAIVSLLGVFVIANSHTYVELLSGRLVQGIGVGIITIAIPLYLAEAIPPSIRGKSICAFQLMLTFGILMSSLVGLYFTHSANWRGMFWSTLLPGAILFVGSFFLPESPRWLCLQGHFQQAFRILLKSRTEAGAREELSQMQLLVRSDSTSAQKHEKIWQRKFIYPLIIVLAIACLGQLTGINSFLQLAPMILKSAGLSSDIVAMLGNTAITALNFLVTIVALFLIERLGRRFLLCLGTAGIVFSLAYLGLVFYMLPTNEIKGILLLIGILSFILFFAIGPGVVIWMVISELLPLRIRSSGMAVALFLNSMTSAVLATSFLGLADSIGYSGVFWLCAFFTLVYFLTVFFFVPETKNKTLEEIEKYFSKDFKITESATSPQ